MTLSPSRPMDGPDSQLACDKALALVDRYRYWLFGAVLGIFLLGFNGQWRVDRDSALYLIIGHNLADGHGYTERGQVNHLAFPGLPYTLDATFRVFHTRSVVPALVLMLLMGWATLGLTYRMFLLHSGRPTAVMMTVGLGMTRLFYRYCFEILTDLPFLLGTMAFLAGYEAVFFSQASIGRRAGADLPPRRAGWFDYFLLAAGLGIGIVMRPVIWVLLLAIVLTLGWQAVRKQFNRVHIGIVVGVIIAMAIFFCMDPRRRGGGADHRSPTEKDLPVIVDGYEETVVSKLNHPGPLFKQIRANTHELFEAAMIKGLFGCRAWRGMNTVIGALIIVLAFRLFRHQVLWGLLAVITIGMLLVFEPIDRYFVAVIPLLVFAWWEFLVWLNRRLRTEKQKSESGPIPLAAWAQRLGGLGTFFHWLRLRVVRSYGDLAFIVLFCCGIGMNMARITEMIVEQRRLPFLAYFDRGRYQSIHRVAELVNKSGIRKGDYILVEPKKARILNLQSRSLRFYEPTSAFRDTPDPSHVFFLAGPSWDDPHKEERPTRETERKTHPIDEFLAYHHWKRGELLPGSVKGPYDQTPWVIYRIVPQ